MCAIGVDAVVGDNRVLFITQPSSHQLLFFSSGNITFICCDYWSCNHLKWRHFMNVDTTTVKYFQKLIFALNLNVAKEFSGILFDLKKKDQKGFGQKPIVLYISAFYLHFNQIPSDPLFISIIPAKPEGLPALLHFPAKHLFLKSSPLFRKFLCSLVAAKSFSFLSLAIHSSVFFLLLIPCRLKLIWFLHFTHIYDFWLLLMHLYLIFIVFSIYTCSIYCLTYI